MVTEEKSMVEFERIKPRILVAGGVLGALVGVGAAYLLIQNKEADGEIEMNVGQGVKLGVLVFSLLRSVSNL